MRVKLNENLDVRLADLLMARGHQTATVVSQALTGRDDEVIYTVCRNEGCVLVTLDLDFANPFRFPPEGTEGIVVLRPARPTVPQVAALLQRAFPLLEGQDLRGRLWIAEPSRVRVYHPPKPNQDP
jgi:predicted nuclease of predicted toxin-antitoxin system